MPETILTAKDALNLYSAMFEMDGAPSANGSPRTPYKLGATVRIALGRNARTLEPFYALHMERKQQLRTAHLGYADSRPDDAAHPNWPILESAWKEVMDAEHSFDLVPIRADQLNAETNPIPVAVLAALSPIIET